MLTLNFKLQLATFNFQACTPVCQVAKPLSEVCLRQIGKRGRSEEKNVSLDYLQKLYYEHQMLNQLVNSRIIIQKSTKTSSNFVENQPEKELPEDFLSPFFVKVTRIVTQHLH